MDLCSSLSFRFTLNARVFYAGALCGIADFDNKQGIGMLHVLRRGRVRVAQPPARSFEMTEPTLLSFRQPFAQRPGRTAGIARLVEFFVVLLLRHCIEARLLQVGVLAALADARLAKALTEMHERPEQAWTLETLARAAGMWVAAQAPAALGRA